MKRRFTILTAALALLACLALPLGMRADEASYVFNTDAGIAALGIAKPSTGAGTSLSTTTPYTVGQISMSVTHGSTDTRVWNSNGTLDLRIYKNGGSLTFAATSGYNITGITITGSAVGNFTVNVGTYSSGSWSNGTTGASSVIFTATNTGKINTITVTYSGSGGSSLEDSDLALVDTPVELEFDLYDNANAQTVSYTTSSTGAVTVSQSNYITATVNANNTITVTPVAVTNGPQTITVNQAADNTYAAGSVTFTVDIEDSTPTTGSDVTFDATEDKDLNNTTQGEGSIVKNGVTFTCSDGILGNGTEYRLYKNSTTTFSVESGTITQIVFTCPSGNPASGFGTQTGWTTNGNNGTWTGSATSVSFVASSKQVRATTIVVTVETSGTPDPTISADDVNIAYSATSGSITYTINNEPSPAGTLTAAVTDGNWLTLGQGTTSPIAFTCTANENTTERTATVTLTYTYDTDQTVTATVTVTQAATPVIYDNIEDLFAAATSNATDVTVSFESWFVTGVSTNGKSVYVTDGTNGFVIFDNSGNLGDTYNVDDLIEGTTTASLVLYTGFAELKNVDATNLTMTSYEAPAFANVDMADLAGVNTGALVHYDNLTCSVDDSGNTTKYYLSDGNTTIQVYNALYAFDALEDGKIYNITGVYQQYNNTKEILPRSANDIEEVVSVVASITVDPDEVSVDAEEHDGTLDLAYENLPITDMTDFDIQYYDAEGEETTEPAWIEVLVAEQDPEIGEGYVVSYYMYENEDAEARTVYFKVYALDEEAELVYSNLVTITQAAPVAPSTGYEYALYTGTLVEGDYVICYNNETWTAAMKNTVTENNRLSYEEVITTNNVVITDDATIVWHIAQNGDYWTIYNADADAYAAGTGVKNKAQMLDVVSDYALWSVDGTETYDFVNKGNADAGVNAYLRNNTIYGFACYAPGTGGSLSLYKKVEDTPVIETFTKPIDAYDVENERGWYLIASPLADEVNLSDVAGLTNETFRLYSFNQGAELEWQYYVGTNNPFSSLVNGKGYLYANTNDVTLTFTGVPYNGEGNVTLSLTEGAEFAGWNLVGNPFTETAYIDRDFYRMNYGEGNTGGNEIIAATSNSIAPMEGVFVIAEEDGESLTFTTNAPSKGANLALNVSHNRGSVIDRAILNFGKGGALPKFQLNPNHTKVYIPQYGKDYAVVNAESQGEMPVSFKAEENGTYTLSFNAEEVSFNYLHLIDNMTGTDIDLLANPNYSFEARTTDYESRFKLVFCTGDNSNDDSFAFFSNGNWIINNDGKATLQVIDVNGRILSSETVSGSVSKAINAASGVYMLRLINGDNVRVQKVVVE